MATDTYNLAALAEASACNLVLGLLKRRTALAQRATDYDRLTEAEINLAEEALRHFDEDHPGLAAIIEEARQQ